MTAPEATMGHSTRFLAGMAVYYVGTTAVTISFTSIIFPVQVESVVRSSDKSLVLGLVAGVALAVGIIANVFSGVLSDHSMSRWGRRTPFVLIGAILAVPSILLTAFLPLSLLLVSLAYLLVQSSISFSSGAYQPLIVDIVPSFQRGGAAVFQVVLSFAGSAIGYNVAGSYISAGAMRFGLEVLALIFGLTTLISLYLVRPLDMLQARGYGVKVWASLKGVFRLGRVGGGLFALMIAGLLVALGSSSIQFFGIYYLETILHQGRPAEALAISGTIGLVVSTFANLIWFRVSNKVNRRKMLISLTLLAGALNLLFPFLTLYSSFVAVSSLFGASLGLYYSAAIALASTIIPMGESGKYMAYFNLPSGIGTAVSPIIGGIVVAVSGGSGSVSGFLGLFAITSLFLFTATLTLLKGKTSA